MIQLRETFNTAATRYHRARPGYPEEMFNDLVRITSLEPGARLLEIGPGTGIATEPLARRGYSIQGIELGDGLAIEARKNLAAYPGVSIDVGQFETFPLPESAFDLVYSATAFHWIKQPLGYQKVAESLKPGCYFAEFRHHHIWTPETEYFHAETQKLYLAYDPDSSPGHRLPLADEVETRESEILDTGLFEPPTVNRYLMNIEHTPESFMDLLLTFSGHIALPDSNRSKLINGIGDVIRGMPGKRTIKTLLIILHVARVKS